MLEAHEIYNRNKSNSGSVESTTASEQELGKPGEAQRSAYLQTVSNPSASAGSSAEWITL